MGDGVYPIYPVRFHPEYVGDGQSPAVDDIAAVEGVGFGERYDFRH